ncbi:MAG TPA: hypothetical protein ENG55_02830, partial [Candidatus Omnitrophica bacterium]|nr:hypothetical protein [Candidatus Omnitrophota bacterium]
DLTLVGGWMPYVYSKYLWGNLAVKPITTTDIDFGVGYTKAKVHPRTIFELLSTLDYKERHLKMDRMYPVVLYKEGKVRLDFIAPEGIKDEMIEKLVGRQININKVDKFEFLLKYRIAIEIKDKKKRRIYEINCPRPSAFLYHKCATFIDREDEQKQAKDLHYIYFILRYAPDLDIILKEVAQYKKQGYFKKTSQNLGKYFERKTSCGCLMVEKENGPDLYVDDLRQDIFDRFKQLHDFI